jgi:lysophospholipid acyltransferase (LPLAT)-like uncharacterized protein
MVQTLCILGYWLVRALLATVPSKYWRTGRDFRPVILDHRQRYIYVMWHEYLFVPLITFAHSRVRLLVSKHSDGQIVAEMCKHLRMGTVCGSTNKGGVEAVRQLLKPSRYRYLAVVPDGPRGPRRKVQPGVIYLAARLGWPIVPVGIGYYNPWRLRSWDRLAIPKPYHRAAVVSSEALVVPANLDRDGLELYRRKLEDQLNILTAQAEEAAHTGKRPQDMDASLAQVQSAAA